MEWSINQLEAIKRGSNPKTRILPITGEAGSGKTSILQAIYESLISQGFRVACCAPTGKAARRITEATSIPAVTLHKLLEYPSPGERDPKTGKPYRQGDPKKDRFNPLEYDFILADEYKMVNQALHRNLIDALPRGGGVRMFGDSNQLPPIETNKVLQKKPAVFDVALKQFDGIVLSEVFRQATGNTIVENAHLILKGRMPARKSANFNIEFSTQPVKFLSNLVLTEMFKHDESNGKEGILYNTLDNQIISPSNITWVGTHKLNAIMQNIYIDKIDGWMSLDRNSWDKTKVRINIGDKVIFTVNNYDLELFNGESGIVIELDYEYGSVIVDFGDRIVTIPPSQLIQGRNDDMIEIDPRKAIQLAYVVTTHKAQGSEFDNVIYVMNKSQQNQLYRANYYTGVTRARYNVITITDQIALNNAITKTAAKVWDKK